MSVFIGSRSSSAILAAHSGETGGKAAALARPAWRRAARCSGVITQPRVL
jgi:hypothetical protein